MTYQEQSVKLTKRYNEAIRTLEDAFIREESQLGWLSSSTALRRQYSSQYDALASEYRLKIKELFRQYKIANPEWARKRQRWGVLFFIGIFLIMGSCMGHVAMTVEPEPSSPTASKALSQTEEVYWNAENIPIPYLKDSTQYVSNPDHVLQQQSVDRMNIKLKQLENELGVQSVVIVVNHIENDDPFRMAQDVGNKYGVGYQDMGLIVVVGYQDHSINMSPGKKLEADLTDAECHRLEQEYVVPAMRRDMPDSAMIYLTEAVYNTLQKKQLPVMSLKSQSEDDDPLIPIMGLYFLLLIFWMALYLKLNDKYAWATFSASAALLANPFVESTSFHIGGGGGFGGGGGSFGGGGGFGGGSFGGGSFGGGGATSRW